MGTVLVTGATGFLGGAIARELVSRGLPVRATGRNKAFGAALSAAGVEFWPCELDADPLEAMVDGCSSVIHAAALSSPWGRRETFVAANVRATQRLLHVCSRACVDRFVHISTPSVSFAFRHQSGLTEEAPWSAAAVNDYIATKREAETLARQAGAVVLRPKAIIGPGDQALLPRLLRVAGRGVFPLFGASDPLFDLTWIADAVQASLLALEAPELCRGRVYQVTSGQPLPRSVVLETLFAACHLEVRYRQIPLSTALAVASCLEAGSRLFGNGAWEPPLTRYTVGALAFEQTLDIRAARRDLGFEPRADLLTALTQCGEAWRQSET